MGLDITAISAIVAITILVAVGIIKEKYYPYCVGIMALGLVYSTTMLEVWCEAISNIKESR